MRGLPLNSQLTDLSATFVSTAQTAAVYRMYDLGPKPSLVRQEAGMEGFAIEVELWDLPLENVGSFILCALLLSDRHKHMCLFMSMTVRPGSGCSRSSKLAVRRCDLHDHVIAAAHQFHAEL